MLVDSEDLGRRLYKEVVLNDEYLLRTIPQKQIKRVVDIGANVGFFAVRAHELFPEAAVHCFEPVESTLGMLLRNTVHILDFFVYNTPLGEPGKIEMLVGRDSGENFVTSGASLHQLLSQTGCDDRTLVKIDCEGGERCLFSEVDYELLRRAFQVSMEIHFLKTFPWPIWKRKLDHIFNNHTLHTHVKPHAATIVARRKS